MIRAPEVYENMGLFFTRNAVVFLGKYGRASIRFYCTHSENSMFYSVLEMQ